ncbi:hypothetical protein BT63DRAFT_430412 [Microthyrium microscopicum]|uniref:BTB domain-containing protein n=1 Tax=Microthyrium microscopicum TaxID=703497 RepID=A0A6A6TVU2_9PEZI|nr:hypothetical protein BT63DRAFT_430412 [Microthyrium microscopicum]
MDSQTLSSISKRFDDVEFSDLTVACGERTWKIHKVIVCCQSNWFRIFCSYDYPQAPARAPELTFEKENPLLIDFALRWMYGGSALPKIGQLGGYDNHFIAALEQYRIAHFFEADGLVKAILEELVCLFAALLPGWDYPSTANEFDPPQIQKFVDCIKHLCSQFDRGTHSLLFKLLDEECIRLLPVLSVSKCFLRMVCHKDTMDFGSRIFTAMLLSDMPAIPTRANIKAACWNCRWYSFVDLDKIDGDKHLAEYGSIVGSAYYCTQCKVGVEAMAESMRRELLSYKSPTDESHEDGDEDVTVGSESEGCLTPETHDD